MKAKIFLFTVFVLMSFGGNAFGQTGGENPKPQENEKPLKIKKKPFAKIRGADCSDSIGVASVRVTFDKSAIVTVTELVASSGCGDFDDSAVKAAQKIKFDPAVKNGEAITSTKVIQYSFRKF